MAKPKKVNFEVITEDQVDGVEPYAILSGLREQFHGHLSRARIVLAWRKELKPDADNHLILGKCVKVSDLYKELADYDFIILLNREVWHDPLFTKEQKTALVDHELCHADVACDDEGATKMDARGRIVYRIRKHDIEEFGAVVARHGCYKRDLEEFAKILREKAKRRESLPFDVPEERPQSAASAND